MARIFQGVVSSDKAAKTITVVVLARKTHPVYHKQYLRSKKFTAHDEKNEAKTGDTVVIVETRPLSATKRYRLEKIVQRAAVRHQEPEETKESA